MSGSARAAVLFWALILLGLGGPVRAVGAHENAVRVAVWNVRNYLVTDRVVEGRYRRAYPKPEAEKSALRSVMRETDADVLALQEMGDERFLHELQRDLQSEGLDYPYAIVLKGPDESRHLAVLSKIPFQRVMEHRELPFRYLKNDGVVKRGLLEIVFSTGATEWTLCNVHLKSRYSERADDAASLEQRNGEATAIRNIIAERLEADPRAAIFVVGDFNDHRGSRPLRRFLAINERPLLQMLPVVDDRGDAWTHHYEKEDSYERIDFLLVSPEAEKRMTERRAWIPDSRALRAASDHRMLVFEVDAAAP